MRTTSAVTTAASLVGLAYAFDASAKTNVATYWVGRAVYVLEVES